MKCAVWFLVATLAFAGSSASAKELSPASAEEPVGGLEQVEQLVHQGAIDRALVRAKALLAERPNDLDVHVCYQDVALAAGNEKDLVRVYKAAAKDVADGAGADAIFLHARLLSGRTAQAEFRRALKADPDHVRTLLALGELYISDAQISDAETVLGHAAEVAPALAAPQLGLAHTARLRDAPDEVEAALRKAMALEPALVLARVELAAHLFHSARYDEARTLLEETTKLVPDDPLPLIALGQLDRVLARDELAMREIRKKEAAEAEAAAAAAAAAPAKPGPAQPKPADPAKPVDPAKPDGGDGPAAEPEAPKTPEGRALASFQAATDLDGYSVPALLMLAHSAIVLDQPIVARGALDVAAKLEPSHPDVRLLRAYLEIESGRFEVAGKVADELLKEQRDLPAGLYVRGVSQEMQGSARKAEKDYEKAVRESNDDPLYHRAMGALFALQAKWKDAVKAYETVVKLTDSEPNALWDLARAHRWSGKPKEAAATLELLVATDPESLYGWLELGQVCQFELRKQERRAAQAYQAYIDLGGDNVDAPFWLAECEKIANGK